jgi:hypothetical protein
MEADGRAIEDWPAEERHCQYRREQTVMPGSVARLIAGGFDGVGWQLGSPSRLASRQHGGDTGDHPSTFCR